MPSNPAALSALQRRVWDGRLPLEIRLAPADCRSYADSEPYLIQYPRLSYLAFLLPRLHTFFAPKLINPDTPANEAWFEFETVPLKWHYPAGLLYDIHSGAEPVDLGRRATAEASQASILAHSSEQQPLPWKLVVHYSELPSEQLYPLDAEGRSMRDSFVNAVKEADFIRNGSARTIMGMSKEDSENLWKSVEIRMLFGKSCDLGSEANNRARQTTSTFSTQSTTSCSILQA
jgi:autophagy-related protein 5